MVPKIVGCRMAHCYLHRSWLLESDIVADTAWLLRSFEVAGIASRIVANIAWSLLRSLIVAGIVPCCRDGPLSLASLMINSVVSYCRHGAMSLTSPIVASIVHSHRQCRCCEDVLSLGSFVVAC